MGFLDSFNDEESKINSGTGRYRVMHSFDEVKETIRRSLVQQKQNAKYMEQVNVLKEKYLEK